MIIIYIALTIAICVLLSFAVAFTVAFFASEFVLGTGNTTSTSLSTRMFSFTLSLLRVFQKSVIILLGSSTPIIWNRLLTSFSCKSSSTPSRISPPMVLAKAEYVCQIDFGTSVFAFLHSSVTRSPLCNASFIVSEYILI